MKKTATDPFISLKLKKSSIEEIIEDYEKLQEECWNNQYMVNHCKKMVKKFKKYLK